jgi:hypothetical protein
MISEGEINTRTARPFPASKTNAVQSGEEGSSFRPRVATDSADGDALRNSAMARASSRSLIGVGGGRKAPTPKLRTISS